MRRLSLLGSTGSIGRQTLDVVSRLPNRLKVVSLAARKNVDLLAKQVQEYKPSFVSVDTEYEAGQLRRKLHNQSKVEIGWGPEGIKQAAAHPEADITLVAVAGTVGLAPTLAAISAGKDIALASKEVLVAAGNLVTNLIAEKGVRLLPVDSEHSAIFQCLQGHDRSKVRRIILTASGGPFKDLPLEEMKHATVEQALAHPTWTMGRKITIDSATMMNKGLEIVEARWLFGLDPSQIEVVIHPQSIVHSMVEFEDGSVLAQMGMPDMRLPIQYALIYPDRLDTGLPRLEITCQRELTFARPDLARYPALTLAYRAAQRGGTMPAVMNAANEVAVELFLERQIGFLDIVRIVDMVMQEHVTIPQPNLSQILEADSWARKTAIEKRRHIA